MKSIILAVLACFLLVGPVMAGTDRGQYTTPSSSFTDWLNNNDDFYHIHPFNRDERNNELGVGLDLVLWESPTEAYAVQTETRLDTQNSSGEWKNYIVVKVNLWQLFGEK